MRVMLDTNLLISSGIFAGKHTTALTLQIADKHTVVLSSRIIDELREVAKIDLIPHLSAVNRQIHCLNRANVDWDGSKNTKNNIFML